MWWILDLKNKFGLFEDFYCGFEEENMGEILMEELKEIVVKLVEKSCVLLKNEDMFLLKKY